MFDFRQLQRKWRQKELDKIRKRMREIENINRIRERQIEEKRTSLICTSVDKKEEANKIETDNKKLRDELISLQLNQKQVNTLFCFGEKLDEKLVRCSQPVTTTGNPERH